MRRLTAIVLAILVGTIAPALAQSPGTSPVRSAANPDGLPPGGPISQNGLDAYGQAPPPDNTALLIGGGLLVGGVLAVVLLANKKDDTPAPAPVSP